MNEEFENQIVMRKLARLNEGLESRFGFRLNLKSPEHLREVFEHYTAKKDFIIAKHGLAEAFGREDYAKAAMISEAIALMLREIAPSRLKPRTRRKGTK